MTTDPLDIYRRAIEAETEPGEPFRERCLADPAFLRIAVEGIGRYVRAVMRPHFERREA